MVAKKTSESPSSIIVDRIYRTPGGPSGLLRVLGIQPASDGCAEAAYGVFVGDHPEGHKAGDSGGYFTEELIGREVPE